MILLEQQMLQHIASWLDNNPVESFCGLVVYRCHILYTGFTYVVYIILHKLTWLHIKERNIQVHLYEMLCTEKYCHMKYSYCRKQAVPSQSNFMNVVAMQSLNIFKDLDFKLDDNCMSPWGQSRRGKLCINFIVMATWTPTRSGSLTPWPRQEILYFCSLKPLFLLIGICVNHMSLKHYF